MTPNKDKSNKDLSYRDKWPNVRYSDWILWHKTYQKYILVYTNSIKICFPTISVLIMDMKCSVVYGIRAIILGKSSVKRICLCHKKHSIHFMSKRVNVCCHNDWCQKPDFPLSDKMVDTNGARTHWVRWKEREKIVCMIKKIDAFIYVLFERLDKSRRIYPN